MIPSSCNALVTVDQAQSEWSHYRFLPDYALIEIPPELRFHYEQKTWLVSEYGFVFEDLIDDCLSRTLIKRNAEEELETWFDEVCEQLVEADWFNNSSLEYLNAIGTIFSHMREQINPLYTPEGYHYYEFSGWFDKHTLLLSKRRFGD